MLVIVALLAGGIVAGKELVRTSELNRMVSQVTQYKIAMNSFRMKYGYLAGDMPIATRIFGDMGSCNTSEPNGSPGTCNGNGNGLVEYQTSGSREGARVWEQLAMAGLVEGGDYHYDPTSPLTEAQSIGVEFPKSIRSTGVAFQYVGPGQQNPAFYGWIGHFFLLGRSAPGAGGLQGAFLDPAEIYGLDLKIDDGRAGFGKIMGRRDYPGSGGAGTRCVSVHITGAASNANYVLTSIEQCTIVFAFD